MTNQPPFPNPAAKSYSSFPYLLWLFGWPISPLLASGVRGSFSLPFKHAKPRVARSRLSLVPCLVSEIVSMMKMVFSMLPMIRGKAQSRSLKDQKVPFHRKHLLYCLCWIGSQELQVFMSATLHCSSDRRKLT